MVNPWLVPVACFVASRRMLPSQVLNKKYALPSASSTSRSATTTTASAVDALPPLTDAQGKALTVEEIGERFANKRVALYFSAGWCPMCVSFEPALLQFQQAASDSGKPIDFIYVPSDRSPDAHSKRLSSSSHAVGLMDMCTVPFDRTAELKTKYKIWAGSESMKFGVMGRRSGVPAIVVLDRNCDELAFLPTESQGVGALAKWPLDDENGVW